MGYLYSPHTSAGRIPTEKGYRFYVNFLIEYNRISQEEQRLITRIAERYEEQQHQEGSILRSAIKLACQETQLGGIVLTPQRSPTPLESIKLFRVLEDKALIVMVDTNGSISDELVEIPADPPDAVLDQLGGLLNLQLCHQRQHEREGEFLRRSQSLMAQYNQLLGQLAERVRRAMSHPTHDAVFLEGFVNFFEQPEFASPDKMRDMIGLLDKKENLLQLLAQTLENGDEIMVNIGSDSGLAMADLSIATARCRGPQDSLGRIGLIGPLRMDYARVVTTLGKISKALSDLFLGVSNPGQSRSRS